MIGKAAASLLAIAWAGGAVAQAQSTQPTTQPDAGSAAQSTTAQSSDNQVEEIIVTAQKREERAQNVGMSIQVQSGDALTNQGVRNTNDLERVVPGFRADPGFTGAPEYTIRGIGYHDPSLAANPTVSVYENEVPLPFSISSAGSTLDLQRVEVLKGPQGTLFGENATGGAINYISNQPTDHFEAGGDASYGTFDTFDAQGYLSGPLTDTLEARLALRTVQSDGWQRSYTHDATLGSENITSGRLTLLWKPTSRLTAVAALSGFVDRSETPAPQFDGIQTLNSLSSLPAGLLNYPIAPDKDRAADWNACINDSPTNTHCVGYERNNTNFTGSVRLDYDLTNDITLTSLSAYEHFKQFQPIEADGTTFQDFESLNSGHLTTFFQELRLGGTFSGNGSWIVGVNYQKDDTDQDAFYTFAQSSSAKILGIPVVGTNITVAGTTNTYAVFGHAEYPLTDRLTAEVGLRLTRSDQSFAGCERDNGNGKAAAAFNILAPILRSFGTPTAPFTPAVAGGCITLSDAPNYNPALVTNTLDQDNASWRAGLNFKPADNVLLYANVSQGFKAGNFSALSASEANQYDPAQEERLIAFEAGFKSDLLDRTLQLDGAAFYYDYFDKQLQGSVADPIFGALPKLINIPQSHVAGFELAAIWKPIPGLTLTPAVSYHRSRIDGNFSTINYLGALQNVSGERFPDDADLQADFDAQYDWTLSGGLGAFVGLHANYQGAFNASMGDKAPEDVAAYTLLDLRAGVTEGRWRLQVWGRNVTDQFGVLNKLHVNDVYARYTVMPATYGVTLSARF